MPQFELSRLGSYAREEVLAEVLRVAALLPPGPITRDRFDAVARVSSCTVIRRFGSWRQGLAAAGLGDRYGGRTVSAKRHNQPGRGADDAALIAEMRKVAERLGLTSLTRRQYAINSEISSSAVERRFGSWSSALKAAGLHSVPHGRRHTDAEYFENLLAVWAHHARQPTFAEMDRFPSAISSGAYEQKWGTWRKALIAFLNRVNADAPSAAPSPQVSLASGQQGHQPGPASRKRAQRTIPLGMRYAVLSRDRFKCAVCGSSPAIDVKCRLQVDHVVPLSAGGVTELSNLRTLCEECNIGKSNKQEQQSGAM